MMKKVIHILTVTFLTLFLSFNLNAQVKEPGTVPIGPSDNDQPIGGGAPIGSGVYILMMLGAAYGSRKVYRLNKNDAEKIS
jgi:hypothetical protein